MRGNNNGAPTIHFRVIVCVCLIVENSTLRPSFGFFPFVALVEEAKRRPRRKMMTVVSNSQFGFFLSDALVNHNNDGPRHSRSRKSPFGFFPFVVFAASNHNHI